VSIVEGITHRRVREARVLCGVAEKAIEIGRAAEAERLLASAAFDYAEWLDEVRSFEEWTALVELYELLHPLVVKLETATGKPGGFHLRAPGTSRWPWGMVTMPGKA
jgi:hypothetical protein